MPDKKYFSFLDLMVIIIKWKRFLFFLFIFSMIFSYLAIYFFVNERYESSALLLPSQNAGNTSSLLSSFQGLPLDLPGFETNSDIDLYDAIIESRSVLNKVIAKFNLMKVYKIDSNDVDAYEQTLMRLRENINSQLNNDGVTYSITLSAPSATLAADMANYIVNQLNNRIVELKIKKSMLNREYLEARVEDVKDSLKNAENKMKLFQEKTGMFEAENQTKAILEQFAQFQAKLAEKQTEYTIYQRIYGDNSPQTVNAKVVAEALSNKISSMEQGKDSLNSILALNKLPQNAINYFRYFRDVEIYNNLLEFVLPLYEQAKFQEQKDIPILQVIDSAIPPAKRSFPKRILLALLLTIVVMLIALSFIFIRENEDLMKSDKFVYVRKNLFKWKNEI